MGHFLMFGYVLSCGFRLSFFLIMVLIDIETTGNQGKLQNNGFFTSSEQPFVGPVPFDDTKRAFGLNASVHPEKRPVD